MKINVFQSIAIYLLIAVALFLISSYVANTVSSGAVVSSPQPYTAMLSDVRAQVQAVNEKVNWQMTPALDAADEHTTHHAEVMAGGTAKGDCEDYALIKYASYSTPV